MNTEELIAPWGGRLVDLIEPEEALADLRAKASALPSIRISERAACDLELMATGAFSPLDRFMGREDHERVLEEMRLSDGTLFPIPVALPVNDGAELSLDREILLRDARNDPLAILTVEEIYDWDRVHTAEKVLGTDDPRHPLAAEMRSWGKRNVSGRLRVLQLPRRPDFRDLRLTPRQVRERLAEEGRPNVVAFQARNPLHRAHEELTKRAARQAEATLLLHPVVGMTKPGDVDHYTRVRTYKALIGRHYERVPVVLSLIPLAMRMGGPREAVWHMIIRRNYGANHLIVGRDHAGAGTDSKGEPFHGPYEAQELAESVAKELGVKVVPFREMVYLPGEERYEERAGLPEGVEIRTLSGTQAREDYLNAGRRLPDWFTRPEVAGILADAYPARHRQGFCVWFTGLSGSGKSTTAELLVELLMESGRQVTLLDGDVVRTHLSKGLGFSREDRDTNILRIGFVAGEIVSHGGAVVCAAVSPYRATRNQVRSLVGEDHFFEVFVDTPLAVCEERDPRGLYAKARRGELKGFTGIDDPYQDPERPEFVLDTVEATVEENARRIRDHIRAQGFLEDEA